MSDKCIACGETLPFRYHMQTCEPCIIRGVLAYKWEGTKEKRDDHNKVRCGQETARVDRADQLAAVCRSSTGDKQGTSRGEKVDYWQELAMLVAKDLGGK